MAKENARRRRRPLWGRHPLTLGALGLLGLSGYELWIRLEDFWAWTAGIRHLSEVRGTSFVEDLGIIFEAPEMRQLGYKMLFLTFSMLFALICVVRRNRARGAWALIALDLAVVGAGAWMGLYSLRPTDWAQVFKLVPLGLILFGCIGNISQFEVRRRRHEARMRQREQRRREAASDLEAMMRSDIASLAREREQKTEALR